MTQLQLPTLVPKPPQATLYYLRGRRVRIECSSHVFIATLSDNFDRLPGLKSIEIYSKLDGMETFEGYASGLTFDRLIGPLLNAASGARRLELNPPPTTKEQHK